MSNLTPGPKRTALEVAKHYADNIGGKLFIVTGGYGGIGAETVKALLDVGGKVIVGGRNPKTLADFTAKMKEEYPDAFIDGDKTIDLSDLASVSAFAKYVDRKYEKVDCLICNAGVANTPASTMTKNGFEMQMGTNVIGHFLLAKILAHKTNRQVWLSSIVHKMFGAKRIDIEYTKGFDPEKSKYDGWVAYQQSKLGNILIAKEFAKRYNDMKTASLHPGAVDSGLARNTSTCDMIVTGIKLLPSLLTGSVKMVQKTPEVGASTTLTAASIPVNELEIGGYYDDCELVPKMIDAATNAADASALFDYCEQVTKDFQ